MASEDAIATQTDGQSGIAGYRYNCRYNGKDHWTDIISNDIYVFKEIYGDFAGVNCNITVLAIDNAGNSKEVLQTTKTTCNKPSLIKSGVNTYLGTIGGVRITKRHATPGISGCVYYLTNGRQDFGMTHVTYSSRSKYYK